VNVTRFMGVSWERAGERGLESEDRRVVHLSVGGAVLAGSTAVTGNTSDTERYRQEERYLQGKQAQQFVPGRPTS
jgi:hypothetical protein